MSTNFNSYNVVSKDRWTNFTVLDVFAFKTVSKLSKIVHSHWS